MKILCITIGGTSESSRDKENQLETIVSKLWKYSKRPGEDLDLVSVPSFRRKKNLGEIYKILSDGIWKYDYILLIGKSQGGIRAIQFCRKYYDLLKKFKRCGLITIDPHQWTWIGDKNRRISYIDPIRFVRHWNIFQRNEWPRGGYCVDADNIQLIGKQYDHWNIVTCDETKELICKMFEKITTTDIKFRWRNSK